ncbi:hypothetical protein GCM10009610_64560 [Pseudonocardia xinjiangensis]
MTATTRRARITYDANALDSGPYPGLAWERDQVRAGDLHAICMTSIGKPPPAISGLAQQRA